MGLKSLLKNGWQRYKRAKFRDEIVNSNHSVLEASDMMDLRRQGFSLTESAIFDLRNHDFHDYISTWESYQPRMNESPYFCISDDKYLFSLVFGQFVRVPQSYALIQNGTMVPLSDAFTETSLYDFAVQQGGIVMKDRGGCDGFDVFVLKVQDGRLCYRGKPLDRQRFTEMRCRLKSGLVQELICQGAFENAIFPDSVNTIRIISMSPPPPATRLRQAGTRSPPPYSG